MSGFWLLRFPTLLEKAYREHALRRSIKTYRFNGLFALGVFSIICMSVYRLIPPDSITKTVQAYSCALAMGTGSTLSDIGLTYILFFTYCFVGLRLQLAMLANLVGGVASVLLTYAMGSHMDWQIMPPTFATASFLAMSLAYGFGRQERINFHNPIY